VGCEVGPGQAADRGRPGNRNVASWAAVKNRALNLVAYACAAGDTQPGNRGTTADGRYLMGALATHTGAAVYAADRIQWYSRYNNLANGRFDWGTWEGRLWRFPPDGTDPVTVDRAPVEFADVMGGTAE
jgi:hypothetical protein